MPKLPPLTFERVRNTFAAQVFRMYRVKSGLIGAGFLTIAGAAYTGFWGPYIEN